MLTNLISAGVLALTLGFSPSAVQAEQPAQPAQRKVCLKMRGFELKESPLAFENLVFELNADDTVLMTNAASPQQGKVEGTWSSKKLSDNSGELTIRFADRVYVGRQNGFYLEGTAHMTQGGNRESWTFNMLFLPSDLWDTK